MSGTQWPPAGPTSLQIQIPAYLYKQYSDDENILAFFSAFNEIAQNYLDWFNDINLPIYTGPLIAGPLLDWTAQGIYGISRPALPYGVVVGLGLVGSFMAGQIVVGSFTSTGTIQEFTATDDVFKRIITWFFFKGDGFQYSTLWLKRRIQRFLIGTAGTAPNIDQTYQIGVAYDGNGEVTITITITVSGGIALPLAQVFQAAVASGAVSLPFQLAFNVDIVNDAGPTGLVNDGGLLQLTISTGYPTSSAGLTPGQVWNSSSFIAIVPGITPNPYATPLYYGLVTASQILALGGGNLPLANPGVGSLQLWNNGGLIAVA